MSRVSKATRVATRAIDDLLAVQPDETVLVVADAGARADSPEVIDAVVGRATEVAAETNLIVIEDVAGDTETLPQVVTTAMERTDVLIGLTLTTAASFTHHEVPLSLREAGRLRALGMTKRTFADLTGRSVLDVDFDELSAFAATIRDVVQAGDRIRVTSDRGTDLSASIDGMPSMHSDTAHDPGDISVIGWGEVYQGPVVGTARGRAVVDGPVLGYGWPTDPVELAVEDGRVTDVSGDRRIAEGLTETIAANENADNVAEIAFGINPYADRETTSVWKKGRGRTHVGIGNGLIYDQAVDSPVHVDLVMNDASVAIDGRTIIEEGTFVVGD
jgi:leucyl aminopeptidase (aminopeptidase T)